MAFTCLAVNMLIKNHFHLTSSYTKCEKENHLLHIFTCTSDA